MKKILVLIMICIFTGCATSKIADMTKYNDTYYPPKDENYEMRILDRSNVENEFIVIGEVRGKVATIYDSEEAVIQSMRVAAKQMGGDALIDLETQTVDESHDWIPNNVTYYKAKVIVYKESDEL